MDTAELLEKNFQTGDEVTIVRDTAGHPASGPSTVRTATIISGELFGVAGVADWNAAIPTINGHPFTRLDDDAEVKDAIAVIWMGGHRELLRAGEIEFIEPANCRPELESIVSTRNKRTKEIADAYVESVAGAGPLPDIDGPHDQAVEHAAHQAGDKR